MTEERSRPWQGAAGANGDTDGSRIEARCDEIAPTRPKDVDVEKALKVARSLIDCSVALCTAPPAVDAAGAWQPTGGTGGCGYWLPSRWQGSVPDVQVLEQWQPGHALAAVMGHQFDAIDIDPRNGGDASRENLQSSACGLPRSGLLVLPRAGRTELVAATLKAHIRAVVATAPELTEDQRNRLALLLGGAS